MDEIQKVLRKYATPAVRRAAFVPQVRATDDDARTITFAASTESTDRMGDIIRVDGWQTKNYLQNPVFLWAHNSSEPPIGKCVKLVKETSPPALVQTIEFADADTYPFADQIYKLYKGKFLRSVSVGFKPLERPTPIMDDDGNFSGYEFTSQELLELSGVPIPANPEAVARAVDSGVITKAFAARAFSDAPATLGVESARALLQAYAAKSGKTAVRCCDREAIQRAEIICGINRVCTNALQCQLYAHLLPRALREEFDGIVSRMFPSELEELLIDGPAVPDPDTLDVWLESLAEGD